MNEKYKAFALNISLAREALDNALASAENGDWKDAYEQSDEATGYAAKARNIADLRIEQ